jgi:hypothetical protein
MGSVNGVPAVVDLDEFNGTLAALQTFASGADYAAQYVSQSWPLATTTMTMNACDTVHASLTLSNAGKKSWDSSTELATTQPRDRTSPFADSSWLSPSRPAAVVGTVPPGVAFKFAFDFHAPAQPGTYDEFFGVVEEGVAWFSDPGQGGPPDNQIEAKIQVVGGDGGPCAAMAGDAGAADARAVPDAEASVDGGEDAAADAADAGDGDMADAGPRNDAAPLDGMAASIDASMDTGFIEGDSAVPTETIRGGGCGCIMGASPSSASMRGGLVIFLASVGLARARARKRRVTPRAA